MKTLYIRKGGNNPFILDNKTNVITTPSEFYLSIRNVYLAEEPMEIREYPTTREDIVKKADAGDVIFTFYNEEFKPIVVKNKQIKDIVKTIIEKRAKEKAEKEAWAKTTSMYGDCSKCSDCA